MQEGCRLRIRSITGPRWRGALVALLRGFVFLTCTFQRPAQGSFCHKGYNHNGEPDSQTAKHHHHVGGAAPWSRCSAASSSSSLVHFSVRLRAGFATRDTITTVNQTDRLRSIITTSVARRPGRAARRLRRPPHLYISASGAGFGCSSPSFVVRLQVQARRSSFVLGFVLGFVLKLLIISTKAQSVIGRQ